MIVNTIAAALIMLVTVLVDSLRAQGVLVWLSGSLAQRPYSLVAVVSALSASAAAVLWTQARSLNLLALGEETAAQLGADVARVRRTSFLASAVLVGAAVSVSGVVGFVGLIVPHCLRLVIGSDQRLLIPASFLGAIFLVWADAAARTLFAPTEIPVGVLTALCGGPFFVFLLRRQEEGRDYDDGSDASPRRVSFAYRERPVLREVSLEIFRGERFGCSARPAGKIDAGALVVARAPATHGSDLARRPRALRVRGVRASPAASRSYRRRRLSTSLSPCSKWCSWARTASRRLRLPKDRDFEAAERAMAQTGVADLAGRFFHELSGGESSAW